MSDALRRKIAALEALAASTTFDGERANALAAIAKLRSAEHVDAAEDEEAGEWSRTIDAAESDRIISDMVRRAYRYLSERGCKVYRDGRAFVVVTSDAVESMSAGAIVTMAINIGFSP